VDTIGGWFMTQNMESQIGSEIEAEGYVFKVQKKDGHHIQYLEILRA
jgi:CBS domain containing-hemolysin-like protein